MAILNDTQINGDLSITGNVTLENSNIVDKMNALKSSTVISSSETKTKDMFFGKPIYTKTITFTTTVSLGSTNSVPHGISNIDKIWIDDSNSFFHHANCTFPLTTSYYMSGFDNACPYVDKTNISFASQGNWGTDWTKYITVRYTKTTD